MRGYRACNILEPRFSTGLQEQLRELLLEMHALVTASLVTGRDAYKDGLVFLSAVIGHSSNYQLLKAGGALVTALGAYTFVATSTMRELHANAAGYLRCESRGSYLPCPSRRKCGL